MTTRPTPETGAATLFAPATSSRALELSSRRASSAALSDPIWTRTGEANAWRVAVMPPTGGAVRTPVALFIPGDALTPTVFDVCDLARESTRQRLVERTARLLPDNGSPAMEEALCSLGVQLATQSRGRNGDSAGQTKVFEFLDRELWPAPVDGAELLEDVAAFVSQYVALPPHGAAVCALWLAHTYVFDVWPVTPYLLVMSPTRACGKTTLVDVLAALARRPLSASDTTPAALFRVIEKWKPTLFLDEVDSWLTGKREDGLVNLLNAGARVGGQVMRCVGEGASLDVTGFDVYCPKLLSGIVAPLPDATRSRAIALRLERAAPSQLSTLRPFSAYDAPAASPLASRLARWAADARDGRSSPSLAVRVPSLPDGISGRNADLWTPLASIADAAGGRWRVVVRSAAQAFVHAAAGDDVRDLAELALRDAREYCRAHPAPAGALIPSSDLLNWMSADELRPWSTLGPKGLTAKRLSDLLGRFGIRATQRRENHAKPRGYDRVAVLDAAARYCPEPAEQSSARGDAGHLGHTGHRVANGERAKPRPVSDAPHVPVNREPEVLSVNRRATPRPTVGVG
jgi:putative DNA primase/helicase